MAVQQNYAPGNSVKPGTMVVKVDEVLKHLGKPGRFQIIIFILLCCNYMPLVFNHVVMAFFGSRISHVCNAVKNETVYYETGGKNLTVQRIENTKCESNLYLEKNTNLTVRCEGGDWSFKPMPGETTISMEWDLVCNDEYLNGLATTIYFCGVMLGGLIFGYLCDLIGRRPIMLVTLYMPVAIGVGIFFVPSYIWFVCLRFVQGVLMQGLQISSYVLVAELFLPNFRPYAGAVIECFWGFSVMILAGFAYFIRDWRYMQLAISIPSVLALFYICFIPESLRWMSLQGKTGEIQKTVEKIAKFNKCPLPQEQLDSLLVVVEARQEAGLQRYNIIHLMKTPRLRKRSLIMFYVWLSVAVGYYGLTFRITQLAGNKYLNFFIGSCVEMCAYLLAILIMKRFGRRKPMIAYGFLGAVTCIIAGALPSTVTGFGLDLKLVSTGFAIVGRFSMAGMFSVIFLFTSELFPTVIRNIGMGACAFWARFGGVIAPQINTLGRKTSSSVPIIIFGVMTLIAGFLICFLPETHGKKLPDTIDDVEGDDSILDETVTHASQNGKEKPEADKLLTISMMPQPEEDNLNTNTSNTQLPEADNVNTDTSVTRL
ncbi:organic cation transporter protein-like isoform X2 [Gigantopelta aegis]|nr:organic cation transporter protein-like isoform X2 [Gigantopelta aegis]XP_041348195.1 organic cation transporter protein-like isoform X2 [Gigantopelta aegis]XP_041348196.1 organic cation transporter protein-like isoform X2 [Gigantopelta aegis]